MFDSPLKIVILPPPPPYLTPHNGHIFSPVAVEYWVIKINTKINLVFHNLYIL